MNSTRKLVEQLFRYQRETALLRSISAVLNWDERTMMPKPAAAYRAAQVAYLAGMIHRRWLAPEFADLIQEAYARKNELAPVERAAVYWLHWEWQRKNRLPQQLLEELAKTTVMAQQVWQEARRQDNFENFRPWLEKIIGLKRNEADCLGYDSCRYDALLGGFEPGMRTETVGRLLHKLCDGIRKLLQRIQSSKVQPDLSILRRRYPREKQEQLGRKAAELIGFDFSRGRLDVTAHPFCTRLGPADCRITTRYDEHDFGESFFSILHEAGHGIYNQNLPKQWYGLPPGEPASLGVHESQSRLWENLVGRSRSFWLGFFPVAQEHFPDTLSDISVEQFYAAINAVRPSLIRVEADEVTYNLHILVRFELEQELLEGNLTPADLPQAWKESYRCHLGVAPTNFADGVLQDIHWSSGLFGYFPTYSLGNIYAAQLFEKACQDIPDLRTLFASQNFVPLKQWLAQHVYSWGHQLNSPELIKKATGKEPTVGPLLNYLEEKYCEIYRV